MADAKKGRCRFSGEEELILLREVIALNPFENRSKWAVVQERVATICGKNFSVRLVKEHTENLAKLWQKQDGVNLRKSGSEEQYMEKDQLLHEVRDLMEEFGAKKKSKISTMQTEREVDSWDPVKVLDEGSATSSSSLPNSSPTHTPIPVKTQVLTPTSTQPPTPIPSSTLTVTTRATNPTISVKPTHTLILTRTPNPTLIMTPKRTTIPTPTPGETPTPTPTPSPVSSLTPTPTPTSTQVLLNSVRPRELTVKGSTLLNLKDSNWHREVEEKKIVMEERKLKLEEEKFSIERKEREAKLAMELKERERKLEMEIQERGARLRLEEALMQNATTLTGILAEILKQLKK
ncbi:hypothetical protein R5R35_000777 [Gryllus longicercus]|uniref:Uncharacterized protein n=1 Tax=Gryllus longicercus TaxID=2509291 RepID=A0AAN9VEJ4_9ORTH